MINGIVIYTGKNKRYDMFHRDQYIIAKRDKHTEVPLDLIPELLETGKFEVDDKTAMLLRAYGYAKESNSIDGMWQGEDVFLLGSGGSLKGFNFNRLDAVKTIAINHTIESYPKASALLFGDRHFIDRTKFNIPAYEGLIFASQKTRYFQMDTRENVHIFRDANKPTTRFVNGLYHASLSGLMAINLAIIMGAGRIFLLGYDMHYNEGHHFYGNVYGHQNYPEKKYYAKVRRFNDFYDYKDRIFNLNPNSGITLFEKISIEEALNESTGKSTTERWTGPGQRPAGRTEERPEPAAV